MRLDKEGLLDDLEGKSYKDIVEFQDQVNDVIDEYLEDTSREEYFLELLSNKSHDEVLQLRKDFINAANRFLDRVIPIQTTTEKHINGFMNKLYNKYALNENNKDDVFLEVGGKVCKTKVILLEADPEEIEKEM